MGMPDDIVETAAVLAAEISCSSQSAFVPPNGIDMIERAILAERERCAVQVLNMSDMASRIIAMGWRGNPHMSGDDRNFMGPMHRKRHDDRVSYALEYIASAIRAGA